MKKNPTNNPTYNPTNNLTSNTTNNLTNSPPNNPTYNPTNKPINKPTNNPTYKPTDESTYYPIALDCDDSSNKVECEKQKDCEWDFTGDKICHDVANNPACGFDGGDCCLINRTCANNLDKCACHVLDYVMPSNTGGKSLYHNN